jgi:hypothetical protein
MIIERTGLVSTPESSQSGGNGLEEENGTNGSSYASRLQHWLNYAFRQLPAGRRKLAVIFCRDFVLALTVKGLVSVLPALLRHRLLLPWGLIRHALFGTDNVRFALFVSAYFTSFKVGEHYLRCLGCGQWSSLLSGALAGWALTLVPGRTFRMTLGSYLIFRALHCLILDYHQRRQSSTIVSRAEWSKQLEDCALRYGNVLWFCVATGQLMYSFLMAPDVLDRAYLAYLRRVSYFDGYIAEASRQALQGQAVDLQRLSKIAGQPIDGLIDGVMVPCECFHPGQGHVERIMTLFALNFRDVMPVYAGIYALPRLLSLWGRKHTLRQDYPQLLANVMRSSAFISAIIAVYQVIIV